MAIASRSALAAGVLLAVFGCGARAPAAVYRTQAEALAAAFPDAVVERKGYVLTDGQMAEAAARAGERPASPLVTAYAARRGAESLGTAYFDVHRVRTLPETVMIVLDPGGRVREIQVLAFSEPPKYLAPASWWAQFTGRALDGDLQLKRDLQGITGATITARAGTKAVRRVLAVHQVLTGAEREGAP